MKELYDKKYFKSSLNFQSNKERLDEIYNHIKEYNPKKVLDVGCGLGFLVMYLRSLGIDAVGFDWSESLVKDFGLKITLGDVENLPYKDKEFDLVISTDFFEHLPEEKIDRVSEEMKRVGNVVLARIAYEANLKGKQKLYHCTNKPKDWWKNKLKGIIII